MEDRVGNWVRAYRRAWESNEPADIGILFSDDALYRPAPWVEPWQGRDRIVQEWLARRDEPGTTIFQWSPVLEHGDLAVVQASTEYLGRTTYSNLWIIRFGADGRCREFTEWWMDQSAQS